MFNLFKKKEKKDFVYVVADQVLELGEMTNKNLELIKDNRKQINKLLENDIEITQIVKRQQDEINKLNNLINELQQLIDKAES